MCQTVFAFCPKSWAQCFSMQIEQNISLAALTSWQVGGPAEFLVCPKSLSELQEAQAWAEKKQLQITILSGGSNVLISDHGISGLVICLRNLVGAEVKLTTDQSGNERFEIIAWAGTSKSELLKIFLKAKLAPALFLAGIPGDVGGGIVMNAGVSETMTPKEFVGITDWVEVLKPDGSIKKYLAADLKWSYRHTKGWEPGIIVRAGLSAPKTEDLQILEKVREANRVRLSKQPLDQPSCGSVFVNPPGQKAAQLIDSCGLKGYHIGEAQVSTKHANFIVNTGKASASDVWKVILHVQKTVREKTGTELQTEVVRLGAWEE